MSFVQEVLVNDKPLSPHSWETVKSEILELKYRPHNWSIFLGGAKAQMIVEFVKDKGFYVSAFGEGELEEWIAVDHQFSAESIAVNIASHVSEMPRNVLVSDVIALEAAKEFYSSGKRTPVQSWVKSIELMAKGNQGPV